MKFNITPVAAFPNEATQIDVSDIRVFENQTADCQYFLLDAEDNLVSPAARNSLTNEQYVLWGTDDMYFYNTVAENLNLTIEE